MTDTSDVRRILTQARVIAILGASDQPEKPAHYVPAYLYKQGYKVVPVSPRLVGENLWSQPVHTSVTDIHERVDIVDVFRRPDDVLLHVQEIVAMHPRPKVVWLQLGIRNDEAAERLRSEGIEVIQDRCTMAEHRRLGIDPVSKASQ